LPHRVTPTLVTTLVLLCISSRYTAETFIIWDEKIQLSLPPFYFPTLPFLPSHPLSFPTSFPFPSVRSRLLNPARGSGECCRLTGCVIWWLPMSFPAEGRGQRFPKSLCWGKRGEREGRDEKRNGGKVTKVWEKYKYTHSFSKITLWLRPWLYWSADYELEAVVDDDDDDDEWLMTSLRCTVDTHVYIRRFYDDEM